MNTIVKEKEIRSPVTVLPPRSGNGNGSGGWGGGMPHGYSNYSMPIHPAKFGLWLFIAASIMLFAAFTSAYIVRSTSGEWLQFSIPTVMWFGTAALLISSGTIQLALNSIKSGKTHLFRNSLLVTVLFSGLFIAGQFAGWSHLRESGLYVDASASSAFFYILTVTHFIHITGGIIALGFVTVKGLQGRYSQNNYLGVELCTTYWHFLDALWIYLFVFLLLT